MEKRHLILVGCLFLMASLWVPGAVRAEIEWNVVSDLKLQENALDMAASADGKYLYVLLPGEVLVYSAGGRELEGRVPVHAKSNSLAASPRGDLLYVTNAETNAISVISIDFVQTIDVAGSYFKGPADAPVTVAVFEDFQ